MGGGLLNTVVSGGLALARALVPVYSEIADVRAVLIGGSVARGLADTYSDLEIGVFWSEPPSDADRQAAITRVGGELFSPQSFPPFATDPEWVVSEHYRITEIVIGGRCYTGTSNINTQHFTMAGMERCLADVIDRYDIAPAKHEVLSAVQHGIPLYGEALLDRWRTEAARYPVELACRVIRDHLWFGPGFVPESFAGRGDLLLLYQHFVATAQHLLQVLAGLNRVYYPSSESKWMDWIIGQMEVAPSDLSARLKSIFQMDPFEGGRQLRRLVHETISLLEGKLPEVNAVPPDGPRPWVNTAWARKRFAEPPWEGYTLMQGIGADDRAAERP
jgi:hypothetical protein